MNTVNPEEREICRRRGHTTSGLSHDNLWSRCKWCGTWVRHVTRIEERDDDPPEDEQVLFDRPRLRGKL